MTPSLVPLCVDLDGTLVKEDLLLVAILTLLKKNPLIIFGMLWWLARGLAGFKAKIANRSKIDLRQIKFNKNLLRFLKQEKSRGRILILATANHAKIAYDVANYVGLFSETIASSDTINRKGRKKAEVLISRFGAHHFDYVGNSHADLVVWQNARHIYVVSENVRLLKKVSLIKEVTSIFNWE